MAIYKGGKKIKSIYWGSSGVKAVYKGSTKIYPDGEEYTYTYSDIAFNWSSGTYLTASRSNYVWMTATETKKQGDTVISVTTGVTLTPVLSSSDSPYFTIDSDDKYIRFNAAYQTTDMTSIWGSGTFYSLTLKYMEGSEEKTAGTINVEINKVTATASGNPSYSMELTANRWIPATGGTLIFHNTSSRLLTKTYTSGQKSQTNEGVAMRLTDGNAQTTYTSMTADGYGSYTWGANTDSVPALVTLRMDGIGIVSALARKTFVIQKCATTATTMQLSDGYAILTDGDTATLSTSSYGYLMDNNWNGYQTYTFEDAGTGYEVTLENLGNGVLYMENPGGEPGYGYGTITDSYGTSVHLEFEFGM